MEAATGLEEIASISREQLRAGRSTWSGTACRSLALRDRIMHSWEDHTVVGYSRDDQVDSKLLLERVHKRGVYMFLPHLLNKSF